MARYPVFARASKFVLGFLALCVCDLLFEEREMNFMTSLAVASARVIAWSFISGTVLHWPSSSGRFGVCVAGIAHLFVFLSFVLVFLVVCALSMVMISLLSCLLSLFIYTTILYFWGCVE
ncbi:hypothetical protein FKM82_002397 [Ascaphus truei]